MDKSKLMELKIALSHFDNLINAMEKAPTHKERVDMIKGFPSFPGMQIEEMTVNGVKLKDSEDYKKALDITNNFFGWLEKEGVNVFDALQQRDQFFTKIRSNKLFEIAILLGSLTEVNVRIQPYFLLNTYRTIYELNQKHLCLLAKEWDVVKKNNNSPKEYQRKHIISRFSPGDSFDDLLAYFPNDLRNPIANEDWLVNGDKFVLREDGQIKEVSFMEISKQAFQLFYLISTFQVYLYKGYESFAKNKNVTPEILKNILEGLKREKKALEINIKQMEEESI